MIFAKDTIFICYGSFLFMVALITMLRGERAYIRKEKLKSARRAEHIRNRDSK